MNTLYLQRGECPSRYSAANFSTDQRQAVVELLGNVPVSYLVSSAECGLASRRHSSDITDPYEAIRGLVGMLQCSDGNYDSVDLGFKKGYSLIEWLYSMQQHNGGHPLVQGSNNPTELTAALHEVIESSPFHL